MSGCPGSRTVTVDIYLVVGLRLQDTVGFRYLDTVLFVNVENEQGVHVVVVNMVVVST